ncbi:hypothetical protein Mapa_002946 [Marchantia paleacea]|nr:hypothetical protein Mapa_002946 [Marchantia paleacea]
MLQVKVKVSEDGVASLDAQLGASFASSASSLELHRLGHRMTNVPACRSVSCVVHKIWDSQSCDKYTAKEGSVDLSGSKPSMKCGKM